MQTHEVSAHLVADAFSAIHCEWSTLTPELRKAIARGVFGVSEDTFSMLADTIATQIEVDYPFEPVTGDEMRELYEQVVDELNDMSTREHLEVYLDKPAWWLRADTDARRELAEYR